MHPSSCLRLAAFLAPLSFLGAVGCGRPADAKTEAQAAPASPTPASPAPSQPADVRQDSPPPDLSEPAAAPPPPEIIPLAALPALRQSAAETAAKTETRLTAWRQARAAAEAQMEKTSLEIVALRNQAADAAAKGDDDAAAQWQTKADAVALDLKAHPLPAGPDFRAADAAFEKALLRFRDHAKSRRYDDAAQSLRELEALLPNASPSMLGVWGNELQVLEKRGGHY